MMKHGLSSRIKFATEGADCSLGFMFLFEVSVQSLDESCPLTTEVTPPGLVVLVISVHVVHQPSEAPALLATQLTDAEPFVMLRESLLGGVAHFSLPGEV